MTASDKQHGGDTHILDLCKSVLTYDPLTGSFYWLVTRTSKAPKGSLAGWYDKDGYRCVTVFGKKIKCHRLAWAWMTGFFPPKNIIVDHINRVVDDNRFSNLRLASPSQSSANRDVQINNKHGVKGVVFTKGRWRASLTKNGKKVYEGYFNTLEDASKAYDKASLDFNGVFHYGR